MKRLERTTRLRRAFYSARNSPKRLYGGAEFPALILPPPKPSRGSPLLYLFIFSLENIIRRENRRRGRRTASVMRAGQSGGWRGSARDGFMNYGRSVTRGKLQRRGNWVDLIPRFAREVRVGGWIDDVPRIRDQFPSWKRIAYHKCRGWRRRLLSARTDASSETEEKGGRRPLGTFLSQTSNINVVMYVVPHIPTSTSCNKFVKSLSKVCKKILNM